MTATFFASRGGTRMCGWVCLEVCLDHPEAPSSMPWAAPRGRGGGVVWERWREVVAAVAGSCAYCAVMRRVRDS